MKYIIKISLSSLITRKSKTAVTVLGLTLSVALIVIVCAFCLGLADAQWNILKMDHTSWGFEGDELIQRISQDSDMILVIGICVLFTSIAVAGAAIAMYNTLSVSLAEKARTLSVLSTLGAKTAHKAALLFFDALWVSLIAIPLGFGVGIAAVRPLVGVLNELFSAEYGVTDVVPFLHGTPLPFALSVVALSLMTVTAASIRPALRLFGSTAVEIARSAYRINVSFKKSPLDKLMIKKFGITGSLASCNYTNNKHRYRQLSLSVSLSSLILVLFSLMVRYMTGNGVSIDGDPIAKKFYFTVVAVILLIFAVSFLSAFCILYVSFNKRKGEFAMLKSMGTEDGMLYRMVLLEAVYYGIYMLMFILIGAMVIDCTLYYFISMNDPGTVFIYPFAEIGMAFGAVTVVTVILSVFMTATVKKTNIINELKKTF
ncbi:MAG: FtsX-like permease family protein [Clostridia bacterium]|nr:FtsX-like permease family protein [Clostridia bacterium]